MRILGGVILVVTGITGGWLLSMGMRPAPPPAAATAPDTTESDALRAKLQRTEDERASLAEQLARLENENMVLREEQTMMEAVLDEAERAVPQVAESAPTEPSSAEPERDRRPEPTPEQMAEFRRMQEMQRVRMDDWLNEQFTRMDDPNAAQNFQALMDYREDEMALRRQLRDAKTDAERERIGEDLRATELAAQQLLRSQQDSTLRTLAASSGISDPAAQQKFVDETRATLSNPFFTMGPMLRGGGRGPRGPWGGPPR